MSSDTKPENQPTAAEDYRSDVIDIAAFMLVCEFTSLIFALLFIGSISKYPRTVCAAGCLIFLLGTIYGVCLLAVRLDQYLTSRETARSTQLQSE